MKYLIITLSILTSLWSEFNQIRATNKIKQEAEIAFNNGNNKKAIDLYNQLIYAFKLRDESLRLNLGHAYYKMNQTAKASYHYKALISSDDIIIRSVAFHQLGVIDGNEGKHQQALSYFKQAIKTNPENERARYNYEMIKKIIDQQNELSIGQKEKQKKEQGKAKSNNKKGALIQKEKEKNILNAKGEKKGLRNDQSEKENILDINSNTKEEKKELQPNKNGTKKKEALRTKRLMEINISEEKAEIILESMKNAEVQYLQQKKHREYNKEYKNKPDW